MTTKPNNREYGFTLVELLVGMAILIVVATIGGDLIFNVIRSYNKSNILAEIEQNGNYVMSIMEQQIRNAASIETVAVDSIISINHDEQRITFSLRPWDGTTGPTCVNGGVRKRIGEDTQPFNMITNDNNVNGINVTGLSFNTDATGNVITISMTLTQACNAPTRREFRVNPVTLTTTVVLRSSYGN